MIDFPIFTLPIWLLLAVLYFIAAYAFEKGFGLTQLMFAVLLLHGTYAATEAHKHTHEIIEILAAMNGEPQVFNPDTGERL